jgi:gamma-glutamylcyclotransferase (GGCT)/AIG2-like uncharacterized protein YtfP
MELNLLFVYGTLMLPEIQLAVFGRMIKGQKDQLNGFSKKMINIEDEEYPVVFRKDDEFVEGMVLEISNEELIKADIYETEVYERSIVNLASGQKAFVYHQ